ncbi:MAG: FIST N-terminal domain-containing protein [Gloeomargarita sp. SKYBB_i_bin120]|nr:FIST C-terminal domain-containing protein [Gloeomargarita sp. SKYG98]MCS7292075.1 FIST C-terminal domain-containing protein [Gloeomargarita sp. SKYB120]MDW8177635.1 FIST N-terminal domain-containing protein [Gloeomargarita sp. SKYBB_i_bin120]
MERFIPAETQPSPQWLNALSTQVSLERAIQEVTAQVRSVGTADVALVFISDSFASEYVRLLPLLHEALPIRCLIGCGASGVVGSLPSGVAQEVEGKPALALSVARLPGVQVQPFVLYPQDLPDLDSPPQAWIDLIGVDPAQEPHFILLADPATSRIPDVLQGLDYAYPRSVKVGGLVGDGLFYQQEVLSQGVVGVALSGLRAEAIVAQGCRPIGQPYRVTRGERNIILGLEDRPPLQVLQTLIQNLDEADRQLAQSGLHIGVVSDEFKQELAPTDFLIRNLLGIDPRHGAIAIGDRVRPGQRVQFHLRDAQASLTDLQQLLAAHVRHHPEPPLGALMFACLGRGQHLYGRPNVDSHLFQRYLPGTTLAGCFCNGEIGPVGHTTHLHGYTAVFALWYVGTP